MKIPSNNSNSTGVVFQITGTLSHTPSGRNIPVSEGVATPLQAVHRLLIEANKPPTNYEMADSVPTPQLEGKEIFANPPGSAISRACVGPALSASATLFVPPVGCCPMGKLGFFIHPQTR